MEIAKFVLDVGLAVGKFVIEAFAAGDHAKVMNTRLKDILPPELKTTHARLVAEDKARRKFGAGGA